MGIANIIPGVSGGTIALITNIYEDLIFSLKSFNYGALKLILNLKFKDFSKKTSWFKQKFFSSRGSSNSDTIIESLINKIEERIIWSKYGL